MMTNKIMIRQGDVLLRRIETMPEGEREAVATPDGRVVLAEGEATGHAHTVAAVYATLYAIGVSRILEVQRQTMLEHQEHAAVPLAEGLYEVVRQREYTPERIVQVAD